MNNDTNPQYDNSNTGALWKATNVKGLVATGKLAIGDTEYDTIITEYKDKNNNTRKKVYVSLGFLNQSDNKLGTNSPDLWGRISFLDIFSVKISGWWNSKTKDTQPDMNLKLMPPDNADTPTQTFRQSEGVVAPDEPSDSIPF